ncbi:MAG TPA: glycoside hydrolase family 16 protein [Pyrinomonadaceae bacterium]
MSLPKPKTGRFLFTVVLLMFFALVHSDCSSQKDQKASIEITQAPRSDPGGPDTLETISGRVTGARPGQQIVLYAKAAKWWVQPMADQPFTPIQADSHWQNSIHLGTDYAALLVEPGFKPPATTDSLPAAGGLVLAVTTVPGTRPSFSTPTTLKFSGYDWEIRSVPSNRGGKRNDYDPANAWIDDQGFLHLRITQKFGKWTCAELMLPRSLGYGSYFVVIRDTAALDPAVVAGMFTWDESDDDENHREMSVELARWGDPANKNAQYVVQPYYVPANVARFMTPSGTVTHSFRWEPGKVSFRSVRGNAATNTTPPIAEHVFSSGVPAPGNESIHLNLYIFGNNTLRSDAEVVIEKFEYLP